MPLIPILFLVACAHSPDNQVAMELPFAPELVAEIQKESTNSRAPASLEINEIEGKSPRRVYFSALYHQYLTLGQHLDNRTQLTSCPQFHHDKIETEASMIPSFSLFKASSVGAGEKEYFPETAFNRDFSIKDYYQHIGSEIAVLCEEGVSDNYYKFDNLITHYAQKKSFHSRPDAMKSVLKIPVFANYYLLKMLQSPHTLTFVHPEEKRVISMTQTHWFEKYVNAAHRQRNNLIKNQMVKR
jgi:hypothetical protein